MGLLEIIIIAIGLAMDCFAVATTKGITVEKGYVPQALLMAVLFGLFQGVMPLIGFYAGAIFTEQITKYDHWIALLLLVFIGGKMIWESRHETPQKEGTTCEDKKAAFGFRELVMLAIATSIDALATGIIFVPTPEIIWLAVAVIALVSFLFSIVGYGIGSFFGSRFRFNVELLGGIILIGIGVKIFIEHVVS